MSNNNQTEEEKYEQNRKNNFIVEFPEEFEIPEFSVKRTDLPGMTPSLDNKIRWKHMTIVFYDIISFNLHKKLKEIFEEYYPDDKEFKLNIKLLDATGEATVNWEITARVNHINFGNLNYGMEFGNNISMELKPIKCEIV